MNHVNYYVFFQDFVYSPLTHPANLNHPWVRIHWWSVDAQCQLVVLGQAFRSAWGACLDLSRTWKMRARAGAVGRRVPAEIPLEKNKKQRGLDTFPGLFHLTVVGAIALSSEPTGNQGMEKSFESSSLWRDDWDHRGPVDVDRFSGSPFNLMETWNRLSQICFNQMEVQSAEKTGLRLHQNSHCSLVRRDPELLAFIITARCTTTYNTHIYVYTSWDACNAWI